MNHTGIRVKSIPHEGDQPVQRPRGKSSPGESERNSKEVQVLAVELVKQR